MNHGLDNILAHIEETIATSAMNITQKGKASIDTLNALARVINSYRRLLELGNRGNDSAAGTDHEPDFENGDADYVEQLFASTRQPAARKRLPRR